MPRLRTLWLTWICSSAFLFVPHWGVICHAQCDEGPPGPRHITITPNFWAPGQTYTVTVTEQEGYFVPYSPSSPNGAPATAYVVTESNFDAGNYYYEDPNVTLSLPVLVSPTQITFTATVAAGAPVITTDYWTLFCTLAHVTYKGPGGVQITPCAQVLIPTITSIAPASFFAGETTAITINGTNFMPDVNPNNCVSTSVDAYTDDEDFISDWSVVSSTEITATVAPDADEADFAGTIWVGNTDLNSYNDFTASTPATVLPVPKLQWTNPSTGATSDISTADGTSPPAQSAVVGWPIHLTLDPATVPSGITVSQNTWSVGGTNIGGYPAVPSTPSPIAPAAITPTTTTNENLNAYWVYPSTSGSPFNVTYSYCYDDPIAGQECSPTATAKFNVAGPTGSGISTTVKEWMITPVLPSCAGGANLQYLQFIQGAGGTICKETGTAPGISFTGSVGKQPTGGGAMSWVQVLLNNQVISTTPAGSTTSNAGTGLDNTYPYKAAQGANAQDSPASSLPSGLTSLERQFTAQMFTMWTSSSASSSIPVPLGYIQWQLDGTAVFSNNKWSVSGTSTGTANKFHKATASDPSYGYPTWTSVATNSAQ